MKILGLSAFYHDSAAALIVDDEVVAAGAEERFSRQKHDNRFPNLAINYCLKESGLAINELDAIVFYEKPIWKFDRLLHQHLQHFPKSYRAFMDTTASWVTQKLNVKKILKDELHYHGPVLFLPHHLSHAASSYYLSGFDKSVITTIDGVGEWATTTIGVGGSDNGDKNGDKIKIDQEIRFPHSLGLLYSTLTAYLGFKVNNDEYKVMGLAAYGDPKPYQKHFHKLLRIHDDGSYSLNMKYFDYDWAQHMPSAAMAELFGHPMRKKESKIYQYHRDIAAALQDTLEKAVFNLLTKAHQRYKIDNLCLAGGVALNSVMNAKILSHTPFKRLYIPQDPGDAGGAMGAALYVAKHPEIVVKKKRKNSYVPLNFAKKFTPYLGPKYQAHQIKTALNNLEKNQPQLKAKFYPDREKFLDKISDLLIKKRCWAGIKGEWNGGHVPWAIAVF